jgi:two-component system cell cycle sensor histidine kinase/response regulator CckA
MAVESSEDAIICLDAGGVVRSWNRGAAAIYGYSREEMIGRTMETLVPPEHAAEERQILAAAGAGRIVERLETTRIRKDGARIELSVSAFPVMHEGRIAAITYVARSNAEHQRLAAANAQLRAIIETSEDPIIGTDSAHAITMWNGAAERVFGYTAREAIGRKTIWLVPRDRAQEESELLQRVTEGETITHFETVRMRRDGVPVPVSLTLSPVYDPHGRFSGICTIARETAERHRLEAGNAHLASIVESSEDAVVSKDLNGVIQTWNVGAQRVYGYDAQEAIGRNIAFLLPPGRANEEQEILATLRRGERVEHFETKRLRKDGQVIDVSLGISPIRDSAGRIIGASHVARDVTERKSFELQMQQTQRLESLGVLAGGIAHDFNNLLTGVLGNASLTYDILPSDHPARPLVQDVSKAAERAAQLTAQLLAYAGKGQFTIGPVDVDRLLSEIKPLIAASISKNVEVRLDLNHDVPLVEGDATQIQQLLMNLILNGAEAIGEERAGTVLVRTGTQFHDEVHPFNRFSAEALAPGEYAVIEVRDNGCGMNEETVRKIFDPFFTTKFLGRGLGLAAALGIVKSHKGAIRVDSRAGQGSTFTVVMPASQKARLKTATPIATVLVVDDEEIVRKTAKACLEKRGYRVVTANNGQEAVERFRESGSEIGIVILDLTMPVMGGEEALRQLRAAGARAPVVLSSGYSEADARKNFVNHRLAGFLQKPYSAARLIDKLESVLKSAAA